MASDTPDVDETPSPRSKRSAAKPDRADSLDSWVTFGIWFAVFAIVAIGGFFAYSVYAQQQSDRLSNPSQQAVEALAAQVKAKPSDKELRSRYAEALVAVGEFGRAKAELAVAVKLDPKYVGAYQNLAQVEFELKEYQASASHWNKVLELTADTQMQDINQRRELAYFNLGQIAMLQKDWVGAVGYLNQALRIRKDASDTYLLLAKSLIELEQYDQALDKIQGALAFEPNYPEAHFVRGKIYLEKGDIAAAAYDFRVALDGVPGNAEAQAAIDALGSYDSWFKKAEAAWKSGDTASALTAARVARAVDPASYEAAMLCGQILEKMGKPADAVEAYEAALKIKPDDPAATAALKRAKAASKET